MDWATGTRKYLEGKKIIKQNKKLFSHIVNDLFPEVESDLTKDDYINLWMGICHTFPEYDIFSFLNYPDSSLKRFAKPLSSKEIYEEKQELLNFFYIKRWDDKNEGFDVVELTGDILYYLLMGGRFSYYKDKDKGTWDMIIECPSETDDGETIGINRKLLKRYIDSYLD